MPDPFAFGRKLAKRPAYPRSMAATSGWTAGSREFSGTRPVTLPCQPPSLQGMPPRNGCLTAAFVLG